MNQEYFSLAELEQLLPPLPKAARPVMSPPTALSADDENVVATLNQQRSLFRRLYAGDIPEGKYLDNEGNLDDSQVDWALERELLRGTGLDAEQTERLMRGSAWAAVRNGKWDDPRTGKNYLRYSIDRAIERWADDETPAPVRQNSELDTDGDPCCGLRRENAELKQRLADLQARYDWQTTFRRKKAPSGEKLVVQTLADIQAEAETQNRFTMVKGKKGIPIIIEADRDLEHHPERASWPDRTLSARTGVTRSTIDRALKRYTNEANGVWALESDPIVNKSGLARPQLYLVPKASAAETRTAVLDFDPPAAVPAKPKQPKLIRCKKHPMARINERTTWQCHLCGRHAQEPRVNVIDPEDYVPPVLQNDDLVRGEAESGGTLAAELFTAAPSQPDSLSHCARCSSPNARPIRSRVLGLVPLCEKCWPAHQNDELASTSPPLSAPVEYEVPHFDDLAAVS